jgi:hypothetical protein
MTFLVNEATNFLNEATNYVFEKICEYRNVDQKIKDRCEDEFGDEKYTLLQDNMQHEFKEVKLDEVQEAITSHNNKHKWLKIAFAVALFAAACEVLGIGMTLGGAFTFNGPLVIAGLAFITLGSLLAIPTTIALIIGMVKPHYLREVKMSDEKVQKAFADWANMNNENNAFYHENPSKALLHYQLTHKAQ